MEVMSKLKNTDKCKHFGKFAVGRVRYGFNSKEVMQDLKATENLKMFIGSLENIVQLEYEELEESEKKSVDEIYSERGIVCADSCKTIS